MNPKKVENRVTKKELRGEWEKRTSAKPPNEKDIRMMIKTLWFHEFDCLVQGEWYYDIDGIIPVMKDCLNVNLRTIISAVMNLSEYKIDATKQADGGGRKFNLKAENEGILFAVLSLNMVFSTSMVTCICNSINRDANHGMADADFKRTFRIFCNTQLNTLSRYADVKILAVPNSKTSGDKGKLSPWEMGRRDFQELLKDIMDPGKKFLAGEYTIGDIYSKSNLHPMCIKAVVQFDECNTNASLLGSTTSTISNTQNCISFDASNSTLNKKAARGQIIQRKKCVVAKYIDEACSMFAVA